MFNALRISDVRFTGSSPKELTLGLVGWVTCTLNDGLLLDGLTVRRTVDGRLALSFPARRDATGRQHFFVRPLDDGTRRHIEREVFAALQLTEAER